MLDVLLFAVVLVVCVFGLLLFCGVYVLCCMFCFVLFCFVLLCLHVVLCCGGRVLGCILCIVLDVCYVWARG